MNETPGTLQGPRGTGARRLVRACLFLAVLTPLLVVPGIANPYVTTRTVVFRILMELGLVGFVWLVTSRETRSNLRREPFLRALAAFVAVAALAAVVSPAPYRSLFGDVERLWGIWGWFHFLVFYVLLRVFLDDEGWRTLFGLVSLVATCAAAYMAFQAFGAPVDVPVYGAREGRLYGTMGNPAYMAAFALLALGVALYMALSASGGRARLLYGAVAAIQVPVLLFAGTMSSFLGVVAASVVAAALAVAAFPRYRPWLIGGGALLALAVLVPVLLARANPDAAWVGRVPLLSRLATVGSSAATVSLRLTAWGVAWHGFLDRPLLGWGMDNFNLVWDAHFPPAYYVLRPGNTLWDRAHSAYMEILATLGVAGVVAFIAMGGALLHGIRTAWRAGRLDRRDAILFAALVAAYGTYLVAWFEDINSLMLFIAIAAFSTHRAAGRAPLEFGAAKTRRAAPAILTALTLLLVVAAGYYHGVWRIRAMHALDRAGRPQEVEANLADLFTATAPVLPDRTRGIVLLNRYLRRLADEDMDGLRSDPYRSRVFDDAVRRALDRVGAEVDRDPRNSMLRMQQGDLLILAAQFYGSREAYEAALQAYRQAIRLSPGRIRHRHLLASAYLMAGDTDAAMAQLDTALSIFDGFGETYTFAGEAWLVAGNLDGAAEALGRALELGYARRGAATFVAVADSLAGQGHIAEAADLLGSFVETRWGVSEWEPGTGSLYLWTTDELLLGTRAPALLAAAGRPDDARRSALRLVADIPWAASRVRRFLETVDSATGPIPYAGPIIPDTVIAKRPALATVR